eukprot:11198505-Lingulodinium_polyedra.AAC.1
MEQAGIHRAFAGDAEWVIDLLEQAGIPSPARKQQPFLSWVRGRFGCFPAASIPGQRAHERAARKPTRLPWVMTPHALSLLESATRAWFGA